MITIQNDQNVNHFPTLRKLIIDGYDWKHSLQEVCSLWDWSTITHLELRNAQYVNFLRLIPSQTFSRLKVFIEQCIENSFGSQHEMKSGILCRLIKDTMTLEELGIRCDTRSSNIVSSIARKGSHLRILNLRCFRLPNTIGWMPLTNDQLEKIRSGCPQMMELEVDLSWLTIEHEQRASSESSSTANSTDYSVVTRAMKKAQDAKGQANITDQDHLKEGRIGESQIPSWYMEAYLEEKYHKPGFVSSIRENSLKVTKELGTSYAQANEIFISWKRNHRKEEVAALRDQVYTTPVLALAKFRNLRRLTIFTKIYHFVVPEVRNRTSERTSEAVQNWLNKLLLEKQGADFEKVVVHVATEVVDEETYGKSNILESTFTYAGKWSVSGVAKIRETEGTDD